MEINHTGASELIRPWFTILMLLMCGAAAAVDTWQFERADLTVVVTTRDDPYSGRRSYQIVVNTSLRPLARLEVERDGLVTDVWLTDLDHDGAFEIVVATGQLSGREIGGVDVHEWRDFRFDSIRVAGLTSNQKHGYAGNDQFSVSSSKLYRAYPVFTETDNVSAPSGELARFEFRYPDNTWIAVTARR